MKSRRPALGQHFLRDPKVIQTILAAGDLHRDDHALEIGPGKGILTEPLAARVKRLVVIELDRALAPALQKKLTKVTVVQGDVLHVAFDPLFPEALPQANGQPGLKIKIFGNLPYSITSPIFEKLLRWPRWDTGVFLIQKEVAERMRSAPGSRVFGVLSLAIQLFASVELVAIVPPGAFNPPPEVHSAVIRLRRHGQAALPDEAIPDFFDLVHGAFAHRRKTVANSLALHLDIARARVDAWLTSQRINSTVRAETLGLNEYVRMAGAWAIFRREINLTTPASTSTIAEH